MTTASKNYAQYPVTLEESNDENGRLVFTVTKETGWDFSNKYTTDLVHEGTPEKKLLELDQMFARGSAVYAYHDKRCKGGYRFIQY